MSRFSRSFILACIALLFIATIFFLNPPIRVTLDPRTKDWAYSGDGLPFYEHNLEHDLPEGHDTQKTGGHNQTDGVNGQIAKEVVSGGVIMGKLGNETAK
jgi:hypothetical protein